MSGSRFEHRYSWIMAIDDEQSRLQELGILLEQSGFSYGTRSATNLLLLSDRLSAETLLKLSLAALHTASPDMALNGFERLAGVIGQNGLLSLLTNRRRLGQCMVLCVASPFLTNLVFWEPSFFTRLFINHELEQSRTRQELLERLLESIPASIDLPGLMKKLRIFKRFEILRIAARDLNGLAPLEEVTPELFYLVAYPLQQAYETCHRPLSQGQGQPRKTSISVFGPNDLTIIG